MFKAGGKSLNSELYVKQQHRIPWVIRVKLITKKPGKHQLCLIVMGVIDGKTLIFSKPNPGVIVIGCDFFTKLTTKVIYCLFLWMISNDSDI